MTPGSVASSILATLTDSQSLTISLIALLFASITAPLILSRRADRQRIKDRDAAWKRQDDRDAAVAALAADATARTEKKLDKMGATTEVIHTLVNSNMTEVMQRALQANEALLATLVEVLRLNEEIGHGPSAESLRVIEATKTAIAELGQALAERHATADKIAEESGAEREDDGQIT